MCVICAISHVEVCFVILKKQLVGMEYYKKLIFVVNDDEVNPHLRVPVDVGSVAEWRLVIIRWLKTRIWFDNNGYVYILF